MVHPEPTKRTQNYLTSWILIICAKIPIPHPKGNIHRAMTQISLWGIIHVLSKSRWEKEKGWGLYLKRPANEPTVRKLQIKVYRPRVRTGLKSRFIQGENKLRFLILYRILFQTLNISNVLCRWRVKTGSSVVLLHQDLAATSWNSETDKATLHAHASLVYLKWFAPLWLCSKHQFYIYGLIRIKCEKLAIPLTVIQTLGRMNTIFQFASVCLATVGKTTSLHLLEVFG